MVGALGVVLLCAVGGPACESTRAPLPLVIELAVAPAAVDRVCPPVGARTLEGAGFDVERIRVTVFAAEGAAGPDTFVCDRVLTPEQAHATFYVPEGEAGPVQVWVEAYRRLGSGDLERMAVGNLAEVDFAAGGNHTLVLWREGRSQCGFSAMQEGRAFPSATVLPGGKVLIVGGGLAAPQGSETTRVVLDEGLYLSAAAEIYDPASGTVSPLVATNTGRARALHAAFLLPGSTARQGSVLLAGGVVAGATDAEPPASQPALVFRQGTEPFRIVPHPRTSAGQGQVLNYDLDTETVTWDATMALPGRYFAALHRVGDDLAVAGGVPQQAQGWVPVDTARMWSLSSLQTAGEPVELGYGRVAATLTGSGESGLLVWGGNAVTPHAPFGAAEWLQVSGGNLQNTSLSLDLARSDMSFPGSTVFHTATVLPDGDVLMVGGFGLNVQNGMMSGLEPLADHFVFRVSVDGADATAFGLVHEPEAEAALAAVGYHAATLLADGRVLITGGTPASVVGAGICDSSAPYLCALTQAVFVQPGDGANPGAAVAVEGGLQEPRFGHAQVNVADRGVVIIGGLRRSAGELHTSSSVEVLLPKQTFGGTGDPLNRVTGHVLSEETRCPEVSDF